MNKFSQQIKTSNTDEWYTLSEDIEKIIPYLKKKNVKKVLCPFDTLDSNFVKVLYKNKFKVYYSHIDNGVDFFKINLNKYDIVVSNPPFSKREQILEKLFDCNIPFMLIMNFNGLFDKKSRWNLFKNNKFELLIPKGRMKFFNKAVTRNSPSFQSIWVCSKVLDNQIEFLE